MWRMADTMDLKINIFAVSLLFVGRQFDRRKREECRYSIGASDSNNPRALGLTFPATAKISRHSAALVLSGTLHLDFSAMRSAHYLVGIVNTGVVGRGPVSANANKVLR